METTWKLCCDHTKIPIDVVPHSGFSSAITWTACSGQKSACLRWLLYGYINHKDTHRDFLHVTEFSWKHTHTQPNNPNPPLTAAISGALVTLVTLDMGWGSGMCSLSPSHLSRVSLSEFRIFSSAVRCNTGNVIDELLPKFVLSIEKSYGEYMNYFSVDTCLELQVIKFLSYKK